MQQSRSVWPASIVACALALVVSFHATGQNCEPNVGLGGFAEPTLALNLLNPENVAVSWIEPADPQNDLPPRVRLRVRPDASSSWSNPIEPIFPQGYEPHDPNLAEIRSVDPVLTFDASGRLFWLYLVFRECFYEIVDENCQSPCGVETVCADLVVAEVDLETGDPIAAYQVTPLGTTSDKPWMTADRYSSLTTDRLYVVWRGADLVCNVPLCQFAPPIQHHTIKLTYSDDQGETWSTPQVLAGPLLGSDPGWMVHPSHVAVGPPASSNSSSPVYVAWHVADSADNNQAEIGRVDFAVSTDGASTWDTFTPFAAGEAAIPRNDSPAIMDGLDLDLLGSWQPWVLADPFSPGTIYVVASDDSDDVHASGDDADVYLVRSTDCGETWTSPTLVSAGQNNSWQVFPTAAIDLYTGCIAIMWVDNRNGVTNSKGNYLLDVFFTVSRDLGQTFLPERQLNDVALDVDHGAIPEGATIGDYMGIAFVAGDVFATWIGPTTGSQQVIFGGALDQCSDCPADVTGDDEVNAADLAILLGAWQTAPCGPPDLNDDATVDAADLALLLGAWGPCGGSFMGGGHPSLEELMEELTNMGRADLAELLESVWDEL